MTFRLFVCSDFENCGRPFKAVDAGAWQVHCPYCREMAEPAEGGGIECM